MPTIEAIAHGWTKCAQIAYVPADEAGVFVGRVVTVLCAMEGEVGVVGTEVIVICVMVVEGGVAEALELGADKLAPVLLLVAAGLVLATEESVRFGFWPGKVNLGMEIPTLAHSLWRPMFIRQ